MLNKTIILKPLAFDVVLLRMTASIEYDRLSNTCIHSYDCYTRKCRKCSCVLRFHRKYPLVSNIYFGTL